MRARTFLASTLTAGAAKHFAGGHQPEPSGHNTTDHRQAEIHERCGRRPFFEQAHRLVVEARVGGQPADETNGGGGADRWRPAQGQRGMHQRGDGEASEVLRLVRRFNEAIDEALTESMDRFAIQTDRFRDQFIGVLSHDLRTPLGAVTAGAALLAVPEDNPERRGRVVTRILSSAQRMERMIGDLLYLASARLGESIPLKRRPANLQQVCEEAMIEIGAGHPDAALRWHGSGDLRGEWDTDRLTQVVSNLVGNAIQHGSGTPITISGQDQGDSVTLTVHNGGPPIPSELLPFVFEPFARGREEGASHRIGLGLFIARALVSAHGGRIDVSSSNDAGTTFAVELPQGL